MEVMQRHRQESTGSSPTSTSSASSSSASSSAPKRTRIVVSSSKQGCLTCKKRRVKCDEHKPLCRRCIQGGRLCEGYGPPRKKKTSSSSPSSSSSSASTGASRTSGSSLRPALKTGVAFDSNTDRVSHLATLVLSLDSDGTPLSSFWGCTFPQLSHQVECVKAASAAFGAAYEMHLNPLDVHLSSFAWRQYGIALTKLRTAFVRGDQGIESVALASLILAATEILTQHDENALSHFLGAVQIVHKATAQLQGRPPTAELANIKDELVKVDILIGSYSLAQTPQMAQFEGYGDDDLGQDAFQDPSQALNAALRCLYKSRVFIDQASRIRHNYSSWKKQEILLSDERAELLARCQTVLGGLAAIVERLQTEDILSTSYASSSIRETLADMYGLRTQLTMTWVFISCAHDPFQTLYDQHHDSFRSIISDAAASSRLRRRGKSSALARFTTRPGIVSPLFFVSMRCRDPSIRALATALLKEQGREGPSDGHIMAAIGARVALLEAPPQEYVSAFPGNIGASASAASSDYRIHGHGVFPARTIGAGRRVVDVEFCRPHPPLSQGWGIVDYTHPDHWRPWREPVEI